MPVQTDDPHRPVGVSLPDTMLKLLDVKRGRTPRSAYILDILEKALKWEPKVV
ncbi:MAG: hypothetical protein ABSF09_14200 [Candidatus Bathyarchaeia archaeon]|jgi:metal-responsive CopG/Arc/MetJ family transcriptional regulator